MCVDQLFVVFDEITCYFINSYLRKSNPFQWFYPYSFVFQRLNIIISLTNDTIDIRVGPEIITDPAFLVTRFDP